MTSLIERPGPRTSQALARRLYDAECALHDAHQSRDDAWIARAGDRLHEAVADYLAVLSRGR